MQVSVTVRVPAKVNLHLQVQEPGPDGFHPLTTVFQAVSLYDELTASHADDLSLAVHGAPAPAEVPTDATNLAWRAAALLARTAGVPAAVHLELRKAIPVAGGMAGGSADAAAALLACSQLWTVPADLARLAAALGSDVAFPLLGGTALGTGRGELLTPIESAQLHWVLAFADFGISAAAAYRELDRQRAIGTAPPMAGAPDELVAALPRGDAHEIGPLLHNDLQAAALALAPTLQATLDAGLAAGAVAGIVSGSGPTCAFLCHSAEQAQHVAERLGPRATTATGPVAGATVLG